MSRVILDIPAILTVIFAYFPIAFLDVLLIDSFDMDI